MHISNNLPKNPLQLHRPPRSFSYLPIFFYQTYNPFSKSPQVSQHPKRRPIHLFLNPPLPFTLAIHSLSETKQLVSFLPRLPTHIPTAAISADPPASTASTFPASTRAVQTSAIRTRHTVPLKVLYSLSLIGFKDTYNSSTRHRFDWLNSTSCPRLATVLLHDPSLLWMNECMSDDNISDVRSKSLKFPRDFALPNMFFPDGYIQTGWVRLLRESLCDRASPHGNRNPRPSVRSELLHNTIISRLSG